MDVRLKNIMVALSLLISLTYCGGANLQTAPTPSLNEGSNTLAALSLATNYPADIDIVNDDEIKNIAFITTSSGSPAMVLAVDLNANPLELSSEFVGLPTLAGAGIPNNLFVQDANHAFLLTSDKLIYFSPRTGSVFQQVNLTQPIALSTPLQQLDENGNLSATLNGNFNPSFPASIVVSEGRIAVSYSNLSYNPSLQAAPGMLKFFNFNPENNPAITEAGSPWFTHCGTNSNSGYNATGLTLLGEGRVMITCTGLTRLDLNARSSLPVTPGGVDILNMQTGDILATLDLGMSAPAFRSWALSADHKKAFLGSSSGGYVMALELEGEVSIIKGPNNPIVVTDAENGSDYITEVLCSEDGNKLFAASSNHSSIYTIDLTNDLYSVQNNKTVDLSSNDSPGGITGAGPAALRPGSLGIDFTGADLWVLTGNPGTLAAISTRD